MRRTVGIALGLVVAGLLGVATVSAQEPTVDDVQAQFGSLTRAEIEAMGYAVEPVCVTAEMVGAPAALGAMGFHAVNQGLIDETVDPLQPEVILLDADDNVIGVEYETSTADLDPVPELFGQPMTLLQGGHPGMEFDHYILHVWFIDNPSGQFADFNPNVTCPAPAAPPSTGTAGLLGADDTSGGPWLVLLLGGLGMAFVGGGWALRRRTARSTEGGDA